MAIRRNHRDRLLEGALRCLQTKGYARTTARDIAAAAEANLGSIGYHFGSKEALLAAALGEGFRRWTAQVTERLLALPDAPPLQRLEHGWAQMLSDFDSHRDLLVAFLEALPPASRNPELRRGLAEQYEQSRQAFALLIRGALGADAAAGDVDGLAALLVAVADGLVIQWLLDPDHVPDARSMIGGLRAAVSVVGASPASGRPQHTGGCELSE